MWRNSIIRFGFGNIKYMNSKKEYDLVEVNCKYLEWVLIKQSYYLLKILVKKD